MNNFDDTNLYEFFDADINQNDSHESGFAFEHNRPVANAGFDEMLEVLPDTVDFALFQDSPVPDTNQDPQPPVSHNPPKTTPSLFGVQPIDIADKQNGEIAPFWDFNVEDFIMTPSGSVESNSATISAPNSYNSTVEMAHSNGSNPFLIFANNRYIEPGAATVNNTNKLSDFLAYNTSDMLAKSFPDELNDVDLQHVNTKKIQFKAVIKEEDILSLSSMHTAKSIKKAPLMRQTSTSSLINNQKKINPDLDEKSQTQCYNCKTFKTPLWRRDAEGHALCNACGLFQKLHGTMRPLSLKKDVIKRRNAKKRGSKKAQPTETNSSNGMPLNLQHLGNDIQLLTDQTLPNKIFYNKSSSDFYKEMASLAGKKSRANSMSSSSSRSSSKSVVSILPKPLPSSQRNSNTFLPDSRSAGSSSTSSPRTNIDQSYLLDRFTGTVQDRRFSRGGFSSSPSFFGPFSHFLPSQPNTGGQHPTGVSEKSILRPHSMADLYVDTKSRVSQSKIPMETKSSPTDLAATIKNGTKLSRTSLLSQQLQNSAQKQNHATLVQNGSPDTASPVLSTFNRPSSWKRTSIAASPRNSYTDSIQQQRGLRKMDDSALSLRRTSSSSLRRNTSFVEQNTHFTEEQGFEVSTSRPNTDVVAPGTKTINDKSARNIKTTSVTDDLEWLKFGI